MVMLKNRLCGLGAAFLLVALLAAAGRAETNGGKNGAVPRPLLIVGPEWPPYEFLRDGKPAGIDVDVIDRVLKTLGVPYEIRFYPWSRALLMIEKGKADALLSVSYSPSRESLFLFSESQRAAGQGELSPDFLWLSEYVFFVRRQLQPALRFSSYGQVKTDGYRVGVNQEYSYEPAFLDAGLKTVPFPDPDTAFQALVRGEIDLYPFPRDVGFAVAEKLGIRSLIGCLPKPMFAKPYLLGFARKSDFPGLAALSVQFSAGVREMRCSGELGRLCERHVVPLLEKPPRPLLFVCEEWRPYEYSVNGESKGIDAEVTDRIMKRLGIPYEIRFYPWPRVVLTIEKGKAEAVLSVSYKESREAEMYFTEEQRRFAQTGVLPANYLWLSEYVFFAKKARADGFRYEAYADIARMGWRVGINKGYTYAPGFPVESFQTTEFFDTRQAFQALISDEIDLYPMDRTVGSAYLKGLGVSHSIVPLAKTLFTKPYLAPFLKRSDYPELEMLMHAYYHELRTMRASGEYQQIQERVFQELLTPEP